MSTIDIRKELHEYIDDADERLLTLIYGMVVADKQSYSIPERHNKIVEERLESYEKNPESVITWEQLKANVEKLK